MNKTPIEWCTDTWNPITGCLHGCPYCYARIMVGRFSGQTATQFGEIHDLETRLATNYPFKFDPTFHRYRLDEPQDARVPRNIFVGSMADIFGDWVPDEWIRTVFEACVAAPWHRYLFLTKNPERIMDWQERHAESWFELKDAFELDVDRPYYGTSITCGEDLKRTLGLPYASNRFWSIEPLLDVLPLDSFRRALKRRPPVWVIIGAETGNRKGKIKPEYTWVSDIVEACRTVKIPVFMKHSLCDIWGESLIQEYPWEAAQ